MTKYSLSKLMKNTVVLITLRTLRAILKMRVLILIRAGSLECPV